ncbi:hypothetical protein [Deinococcus fonticola]|uniref:hypothetical protein n=1 Tax=Deinococcus fonticola TaxID=2528713 RepID=UPI0010753EDC|nr:hypothetical protein [Deinococcus fonticola]
MNIAERYVRLAHGIDTHVQHFIDGYSGPPQWADRTRRAPAALLQETQDFLKHVEDVPDAGRREWLRTQGQAMRTHARLLTGEKMPFAEEVRGIYDIDPLTAPLDELDAALKAFEDALPGTGSATERLERLRDRVTLDNADVLRVAEPILHELRRRTADLYGLPAGENFTIHLVTDKPWGGYNWPLGNLQSRIDINTDFPVALPGLPGLLAHEGYPGHHTENAHKETELVRGHGWQEHQLQLLYSPQSVIAEGIATNALDLVMPEEEVQAWLTGELAQVAGLDPQDILAFLQATKAREDIKHVSGTAAVMLYQDGSNEDDVVKFLKHYNAVNEERARHSLSFIRHHRGYVYTYSVGQALVKKYVEHKGQAGFGELLKQPVTPGMLANG